MKESSALLITLLNIVTLIFIIFVFRPNDMMIMTLVLNYVVIFFIIRHEVNSKPPKR